MVLNLSSLKGSCICLTIEFSVLFLKIIKKQRIPNIHYENMITFIKYCKQ